jgi:hypothetical protein
MKYSTSSCEADLPKSQRASIPLNVFFVSDCVFSAPFESKSIVDTAGVTAI